VVLIDERHCYKGEGKQRIGNDGVPECHDKLPKWMNKGIRNLKLESENSVYANGLVPLSEFAANGGEADTSRQVRGDWPGLKTAYKKFFREAKIKVGGGAGGGFPVMSVKSEGAGAGVMFTSTSGKRAGSSGGGSNSGNQNPFHSFSSSLKKKKKLAGPIMQFAVSTKQNPIVLNSDGEEGEKDKMVVDAPPAAKVPHVPHVPIANPYANVPAGDVAAEAEAEDRFCVVCMEQKKSVVVLPCKHLCLCKGCAKLDDMKVCPMCRCEITDTMEVF